VSDAPDPEGRVEGFFHATVTVPDMEVSLRFYRDLLGLEVTYAWNHDPAALSALTGFEEPEASAAILSCPDGSEIELAEFRRPRGLDRVEKRWQDAGLSFAAFRVSGIGALAERLRAAGVRFNSDVLEYPLEDGSTVRVVYCFAPEGTTITLVELPRGRRTLSEPDAR
jgi:glyoxylase I family protein